MKLRFLLFILLFPCGHSFSKEKIKEKVIIKYQKRQKVDLGELSVEGNVLVPGEISIDYQENESTMELYKRETYRDKIKLNLETVL